ncbi:pilus assembly protein TadG-related protein [Methylobacterium sp. WSM2598]|uniref:pilus assembly protein TadG-related protein n=1 Tax=Methylobacterium sp. WSM2598 TaxID=398261 RepID=UPI00036E7407|nr:pilus assembly protein TadG-related protein [Methylobacterium sp. WSM2598]
MLGILRRRRARAAGFAGAASGNVSLIVAFSLIPLIGMIGLGVDYGMAVGAKTKLDHAADAAALAAVVTAKAYVAANAKNWNVWDIAVAEGQARAANAFAVNAGSVPFTHFALDPIQLTRSGQTFEATVTYTATVSNNFGPLFGIRTTAVSGRAVATTSVPSYLDFYLLIDVSGSMGLPSTTDGQAQLAALNRIDFFKVYQQGCQFACHFPGFVGYDLAVFNNIQLRSGAVNVAVCNLIKRAAQPEVANQYRVGLYPFITQMGTLQDLTADTSALNLKAGCAASNPMVFTQLLDTGATQLDSNGDPSTGVGSGGTHFETSLTSMLATIKANGYGDGSTQIKPKPFVFLITDGMQNNQWHSIQINGKRYYSGSPSKFSAYPHANWSPGGSDPVPMDWGYCDTLRQAGVTVSVLLIPYIKIDFTYVKSDIADENNKVNGFSSGLPDVARQCASPGYFQMADTPEAIDRALDAMFMKATQVAHLKE